MSADRVEWHLENWGRFMRGMGPLRKLGWPSRVLVLSDGGASQDFDDMAQASDVSCARAVDAIVMGLDGVRRAAVNAEYLGAEFGHPDGVFGPALAGARVAVGRGLARRGVV